MPVSDTSVMANGAGTPSRRRSRTVLAFGVLAMLCMIAVVTGLALFSSRLGKVLEAGPSVIEVLPVIDTVGDAQSAALAQGIAAEMINGLAAIKGVTLPIENYFGCQAAQKHAWEDGVGWDRQDFFYTISSQCSSADGDAVRLTN